MAQRDTAEAIDAAAARWVARLDREGAAEATTAALEEWLAGDPRRRGALLRAQAVWHRLDEPVDDVAPVRRFDRRWLLAAAGGGLAAGLGGLWWYRGDEAQPFATRVGERQVARLADGSRMTLNTGSAGSVRMTPGHRRIELSSGEAFFEVAKDRARPFVVEAGAVRVEAVGTAFSVRRMEGRAEVVVTEGVVRVWSEAAPARFVTLSAGKRTVVADAEGAGAATVEPARAEQALAWRKGEIVLDGTTLGDAAAEFNRYNRRQIAVEAGLADRRIVGWFRTDDPDGFARSAAAMTGARIERDDAMTRIVE